MRASATRRSTRSTRTTSRICEIAWRLRTDFLGPRPDTLYSATPLYVNNTLYTTAGTRRAVVALDPATGEMKWLYREDEGARGSAGARQGAGRGVAWWSSADGADQRIIYVTPGYRMIALDAKTGTPVHSFGENGVVDLKKNFDQTVDPVSGDIGLNATPLVVGNVIVVGAAHRPAGSPDRPGTYAATCAALTCAPANACGSSIPSRPGRVWLRDVGDGAAERTATPASGRK